MLQALAIRVSINDGISFLNLEHWYCSPTFGRLAGFCNNRHIKEHGLQISIFQLSLVFKNEFFTTLSISIFIAKVGA